jgi:hypothetical protein
MKRKSRTLGKARNFIKAETLTAEVLRKVAENRIQRGE